MNLMGNRFWCELLARAGAVGFEPTGVLPPLVFKTSALVRSATPPRARTKRLTLLRPPFLVRITQCISADRLVRAEATRTGGRRKRNLYRRQRKSWMPLLVWNGFLGQISCTVYCEQRQHARAQHRQVFEAQSAQEQGATRHP